MFNKNKSKQHIQIVYNYSKINKIKQSLNELQLKYKILKQENSDLIQNLKINKEIISSFFKNESLEKKYDELNSKVNEENKKLYEKINSLVQENKRIITLESELNYYKNELDIVKGKNFIFENILKQKESIIKVLKNHKKKENEKHEILYITSPSKVINRINDTLFTYKEINLKLTNHIKALKEALLRKNTELQNKTSKLYTLEKEIKELKLKSNNAKIISQLNILTGLNSSKINQSFSNNRPVYLTLNESNSSSLNLSNNSKKISKRKQSIYDEIKRLEGIKKTTKEISEKEFDLTSEWFEALKNCRMTQEEYILYCKKCGTEKLTDLIEYLYKYIVDKNIQIKLIENENEQLNLENLKLNKENIDLSEEYEKYKKIDNNSTFVNVDNNITHNNFNINMMLDYMKEVQQSVSSTEFMDGLILDQLDFSDGNLDKNINYDNYAFSEFSDFSLSKNNKSECVSNDNLPRNIDIQKKNKSKKN